MSETAILTETVAAARQYRIEDVFDPAFLELIRLVPTNPYVRALILKLAGTMPGPECETFEQIQAWVETHGKRRPPSKHAARNGRNDGIAIHVDFSETEYGRAAYSVRCTGRAEFRISAGNLVEMVQAAIDADDGLEGVVELVAGRIEDNAWNECEPETDSSGDYDYGDHDATGTEDSDTSYCKGDIREAVLAFVRERHPDLAAQL